MRSLSPELLATQHLPEASSAVPNLKVTLADRIGGLALAGRHEPGGPIADHQDAGIPDRAARGVGGARSHTSRTQG